MASNVLDATLMPPDWSGFHADLQAARIDGAQIPHYDFDQVQQRLIAGESVTELQDDLSDLPDAYRSALQVFQETESIEVVLDGLTAKQHARQQLRRALTPTILYLSLLIAVGFLGLYLFNDKINPTIHSLRADLRRVSFVNGGTEQLPALGEQRWLPIVVFCLANLIWVGPILVVTGGTGWISRWLGGRTYERAWVLISAVRIVEELRKRGIAKEVAFQWASDLVSADARTRNTIADWGVYLDQGVSLHVLADRYRRIALGRLAWLRAAVPMALLCLVGGSFALFYCWAVFLPIVETLHELAVPGA
ncbi:MAG: hypothetical protein R3C05_11285 [Pirellulaceae bacterium]